MALVLADRVKETTTSTGTTAITLAGAATGYQTFLLAVGNANTTYYTIADQSGANWEVGIGTYTSSGNTLSRDTVLASSNAGALVTFTSGTKDVFVTYPAERALYTGGPLGTPASGTLTNATGYTYANLTGTVPTWNQNTTGTAANLSGTPTLPSGTTLVAPVLGTPASGTLTNCTFPTLNQNTTGTAAGLSATLAVTSGGTGVTTSTGSGSIVLSTSPTLITPVLGTPTSGTLSSCTVDGTNGIGFRNIPQTGSDKTTSYTLSIGDVGKYVGVGTSGSIVVPTSTFANGDAISVYNNTTGTITITTSAPTAYIGGTNTVKTSITLATRGIATILFVSSTVCVVTGNVS
jgi:hypothetical protein